MNLSKRLALLGFRSSLSVFNPRGLASSYSLIHRRLISEFTKASNPSKNSQEHYYTAFRNTTDQLRAEVEMMRTERARAGSIDRGPSRPFSDFTKDSYPSKNSQHHFAASRPETIEIRAKAEKLRAELAEVEKMLTERAEVEKMRNGLLMLMYISGFERDLCIRPSKAINEYTNTMSKGFCELKSDLEVTKRQITKLGIASMTPFVLIFIVLMGLPR